MKERRVGTLTFGIVLVIFGVLFSVSTFIKDFPIYLVFHFWPLIFIVLGAEVIYAAVRYQKQEFRYDYAAIFLIIVLMLFAMGMAGMDWLYQHGERFWW